MFEMGGRFCLAFILPFSPTPVPSPASPTLLQLEADDDDDDCNHNNKPIAKQKRATAKGRQNKLSKKLFFKMTRAKEEEKIKGERGRQREGKERSGKEREAERSRGKSRDS